MEELDAEVEELDAEVEELDAEVDAESHDDEFDSFESDLLLLLQQVRLLRGVCVRASVLQPLIHVGALAHTGDGCRAGSRRGGAMLPAEQKLPGSPGVPDFCALTPVAFAGGGAHHRARSENTDAF